MDLWAVTRRAAKRYRHLPNARMRFMAVVSEDAGLEEFAAKHETLGVLACSALDKPMDEVAERIVGLRRQMSDGGMSSADAFVAVAELDKMLPDDVRADVFFGLAAPR